MIGDFCINLYSLDMGAIVAAEASIKNAPVVKDNCAIITGDGIKAHTDKGTGVEYFSCQLIGRAADDCEVGSDDVCTSAEEIACACGDVAARWTATTADEDNFPIVRAGGRDADGEPSVDGDTLKACGAGSSAQGGAHGRQDGQSQQGGSDGNGGSSDEPIMMGGEPDKNKGGKKDGGQSQQGGSDGNDGNDQAGCNADGAGNGQNGNGQKDQNGNGKAGADGNDNNQNGKDNGKEAGDMGMDGMNGNNDEQGKADQTYNDSLYTRDEQKSMLKNGVRDALYELGYDSMMVMGFTDTMMEFRGDDLVEGSQNKEHPYMAGVDAVLGNDKLVKEAPDGIRNLEFQSGKDRRAAMRTRLMSKAIEKGLIPFDFYEVLNNMFAKTKAVLRHLDDGTPYLPWEIQARQIIEDGKQTLFVAGPPGCGKTFGLQRICYDINGVKKGDAQACKDTFSMTISPQYAGELLGNRTVDGFKESQFVDYYCGRVNAGKNRKAGFLNVYLIDEAASGDGLAYLPIYNAITGPEMLTTPNDTYSLSPDFRLVLCDNTCGNGGNSAITTAAKLPTPLLDRVTMVQADYDPSVFRSIVGGVPGLYDFAMDMTQAFKKTGNVRGIAFTYRVATMFVRQMDNKMRYREQGYIDLSDDEIIDQVMDETLIKGKYKDVAMVEKNLVDKGNRFAQSLARFVAKARGN